MCLTNKSVESVSPDVAQLLLVFCQLVAKHHVPYLTAIAESKGSPPVVDFEPTYIHQEYSCSVTVQVLSALSFATRHGTASAMLVALAYLPGFEC